MWFNSFEFICVFLPLMFAGYFVLQYLSLPVLAKCYLLVGSLFFYAWWDISYLPLLLGSIIFNFVLGRWIGSSYEKNLQETNPGLQLWRKRILTIGVLANLGLLCYYKYADFLIININWFFSDNPVELLKLVLPLAISFFTFQQIAYLVDGFRGQVRDYSFLNYAVFVAFFPQLIAGPIVHHRKILPQLNDKANRFMHWGNISKGLLIFSIGLFKKVIIADQLGVWVGAGHASADSLTMLDAWACSFAFTLQVYYDFSGYSDMAIGAGLLFNIRLPLNFNSPYKAADLRDFWRRWHMTLGDFVARYVYGPLGGRKKGELRLSINLFISFLVIGIWHGAGWTFVVFGVMQGVGVIAHQVWKNLGMKMPYLCACFITFNYFNLSTVFFRAQNMDVAIALFKAMLGMNGFWPSQLQADNSILSWSLSSSGLGGSLQFIVWAWLLGAACLAFFCANSMEIAGRAGLKYKTALITGILLGCGLLGTYTSNQVFIYFQF